MRNFYLFFLLLFFCTENLVQGQSTVSTGIPTGTTTTITSGPIGVTFIIENTNSFAIQITDVDAFRGSSTGSPLSLYYHTTSLSGPILATDPGWNLITTVTPSSVTTNGIYPTFNGLSLNMPANTVYRFMMLVNATGSVGNVYGSANSVPNNIMAGGVRLGTGNYQIAGQNVCYHGSSGNLNSSTYSWAGTITYVPANACTFPPIGGNATVSNALSCTGSNITLDLTGYSGGLNQTFQWEEASLPGGPYSPVGSPQSMSTFVTPALSPYYRCALTCNGFTAYSQPVSVSLNPGLTGTYTIDPSQPVSSTNFQSFSAAISSLSCGVLGPVTINAAIGSGPYNEQLIIPSIPGASATNTITINGNGVTLQATPVSATRSMIRLNGADYVTINNFNLVSLDPTYGWGVQLINGADYNTISNCNININAVTSTTQSNSGGIVISGSNTSATSAGNANFNTFINNTIIGGYQGIIINGATGALNVVGNTISGNDIKDYYANGITITNTDSIVISNNQIHRPTRLTTTTTSGIEMGTGCKSSLINANSIYDTHAATTATSGTAYGIFSNDCDGPVGFENKITNNIIYKFGSLTGTQYGIYNSGSDGAYYYHNTVVLDNSASTSGVTRGFFQTTLASNIEFKNNIIFISRGGSGIKFCLYFATTTSSIISNNNDLIVTSTSGTNGIGYYGGNFLTLANWKTANSNAYDQTSANLNPAFVNASTGNLTPTNVLMDNLGTPVGITTDYFGFTRSSMVPDMGAIEFPSTPLDINLEKFIARLKGVDVILNWEIGPEKEIYNYDIERSENGSDFKIIGSILGSGIQSYSYKDEGIAENIKGSVIFYRLKITGMGGKQFYSETIAVNTGGYQQKIRVFPNPFTQEVSVELDAEHEGHALIRLTNVLGRIVFSEMRELKLGSNKLSVGGLEKLPAGLYSMNIEFNGELFTEKIMK